MKHRFHVIGLPHTSTTKDYVSCAYTQKIYNFSKMMTDTGHQVFLYGGPENTAPCTEHICCIDKKEQQSFFGGTDTSKDFYPIQWGGNEPYWKLMNSRAIKAISSRLQPEDFILISAGYCQKDFINAFPKNFIVEPFIGYTGTVANFRVFESYSHMHMCYGMWGGNSYDGRFYDAVVPNYYDPVDFPIYDRKDSEDYLLYVGRLVSRKGLNVAIEVAEATKKKLIIAGQGGTMKDGSLVFDGNSIKSKYIEYIGTVGVKERGELMGKARAVLVPTIYVEPFGGVAAESLMAGTPIITTDWGAFTEYNQHGLTGYRCRTLEQFTWAVNNVDQLNRKYIRYYARNRFSLDRVAKQFQEYFDMVYDVNNKGWYEKKDRKQLDWLKEAL
jgi:glycosyltransferase involved in cell wall biosynthesis